MKNKTGTEMHVSVPALFRHIFPQRSLANKPGMSKQLAITDIVINRVTFVNNCGSAPLRQIMSEPTRAIPLLSWENETKLLENATQRHDRETFAHAEQTIDWSVHPPEDLIRSIDLALKVGAHMTARHISESGARFYPDHDKIQEYARVLAPPKVVRTDLAPDPGVSSNVNWLKKNGSQYRGRWVTLRQGELVDSADSFEHLIEKLSSRKGVLLTRVP